jgi:hypothetical protein
MTKIEYFKKLRAEAKAARLAEQAKLSTQPHDSNETLFVF